MLDKKPMPLSSAVCELMAQKGIPDVGVQSHELKPTAVNHEDACVLPKLCFAYARVCVCGVLA